MTIRIQDIVAKHRAPPVSEKSAANDLRDAERELEDAQYRKETLEASIRDGEQQIAEAQGLIDDLAPDVEKDRAQLGDVENEIDDLNRVIAELRQATRNEEDDS